MSISSPSKVPASGHPHIVEPAVHARPADCFRKARGIFNGKAWHAVGQSFDAINGGKQWEAVLGRSSVLGQQRFVLVGRGERASVDEEAFFRVANSKTPSTRITRCC